MKSLFYAACLALTVCGCVSRSPKTSDAAGRAIGICGSEHAASDTLRLGRLHAGETVVQSVDILNDCDEPVVIERTECGCACLSTEMDYSPLMPHRSRTVKITFDTHGLAGRVFRRVDIHVAGRQQPCKIWIEAEVE